MSLELSLPLAALLVTAPVLVAESVDVGAGVPSAAPVEEVPDVDPVVPVEVVVVPSPPVDGLAPHEITRQPRPKNREVSVDIDHARRRR